MGECEKLPSTVERYQERFARVLAHIEANSETPLSIDDLSGIAAFSRHHFHRQFSGFLGMSAYRYVQFMRMRRASWRLAFRPETVRERDRARHGLRRTRGIRARVPPILGPVTERFSRAAGLDRVAFALPAVHSSEANHDEHHRRSRPACA